MIKNYYYNGQLKKSIIAFANIFTGLTVQTGDSTCGVSSVDVPIRYGSTDRVVAAISGDNTQNKPHSLPIMACYMSGLELAPDRQHGTNQVDRRTYMDQGGIFPDDVKAIRRVMPIPYNMSMELSLYTSNTDQLYQVLEQILILFDYDMQIQFNDAVFDWTKISKVTLASINNEENYPSAAERRVIVWSLNFEVAIWLSPPYEVRQDIIKSIKLRMGDMDQMTLDEIDQSGELVPFSDAGIFYEETITSTTTTLP